MPITAEAFGMIFTIVVSSITWFFTGLDTVQLFAGQSFLDIICYMLYFRETQSFLQELAYG